MKHLLLASMFWSIVFIGVHGMNARFRHPPSAAAIGTLRTYAAAQASYEARYGTYATLDDLHAADFLVPELTDGVVRGGYRFNFALTTGRRGYIGRATPLPRDHWYTAQETLSFYIDERSGVRWRRSQPAGPGDAEIGALAR